MQINATLVKGKARVQFGANKVTDVSGELPVCRSAVKQEVFGGVPNSCILCVIRDRW